MTDATHRLLVFRHGETEWSRSGKHTSVTDLSLTETGRQQAVLLRPLLRDLRFARVMTSPLLRALQTCQLAGLSGYADVSDDLMEWNYGDYEGLTSEEIHRTRPGWTVFRDGCPHGETPAEVARRVDRVIEEVRASRGDVALFSHGHVLSVLAARWLGLGPGEGGMFVLDTSTVNILGYSHGLPALVAWNAPLDLASAMKNPGIAKL
jgi:broad specificity phosphatase PhoE